jgi:hypothetical protein
MGLCVAALALWQAVCVAQRPGQCQIQPTPSGHVVVPNDATTVGTYAYYQCTQLQTITLALGLLQIEQSAFQVRHSSLHLSSIHSVQGDTWTTARSAYSFRLSLGQLTNLDAQMQRTSAHRRSAYNFGN